LYSPKGACALNSSTRTCVFGCLLDKKLYLLVVGKMISNAREAIIKLTMLSTRSVYEIISPCILFFALGKRKLSCGHPQP